MKYCEGKTMCFRKPSVIAYAAVVGKAENEGPYGGEFDEVVEDNKAGSDTWEQAELHSWQENGKKRQRTRHTLSC